MKPHKWAKEIKAWADGAEIECLYTEGAGAKSGWMVISEPDWGYEQIKYRIKPQPKEPQYLYAYYLMKKPEVFLFDRPQIIQHGDKFLGKIKLEVNDE